MPPNAPVTIPLAEYQQLQACKAKLYALEAGGVDNWDGYDDAMEFYREEHYTNNT